MGSTLGAAPPPPEPDNRRIRPVPAAGRPTSACRAAPPLRTGRGWPDPLLGDVAEGGRGRDAAAALSAASAGRVEGRRERG